MEDQDSVFSRCAMVDFEKGSPGWDIGQILTRHASSAFVCDRVVSLRLSVGQPAGSRHVQALATACSCGAGDSDSENTTERAQTWLQANSSGSTQAQHRSAPTTT